MSDDGDVLRWRRAVRARGTRQPLLLFFIGSDRFCFASSLDHLEDSDEY
eukprot:COSAG01_NODE_5371_length_4302_cov_2.525577_2_plen_49_part_00